MNAITFIVDKIHIGTSNRQVIKIFYERIKANNKTSDKSARKEIYKLALKRHQENKQTFIDFKF